MHKVINNSAETSHQTVGRHRVSEAVHGCHALSPVPRRGLYLDGHVGDADFGVDAMSQFIHLYYEKPIREERKTTA